MMGDQYSCQIMLITKLSEMYNKRLNSVEDVLAIGDKVKVEIVKIGEKGIDLKLLEKLS